MKIGVFGLGYVGTVTAAILASEGHRVVGVDNDAAKISLIQNRTSPVLEAGLDRRIAASLDNGNLTVTQEPEGAVIGADAVFVCVGSPSLGNGQPDLSALRGVVAQIGSKIADCSKYLVVAIRTTVLPHLISAVIIPELADHCGEPPGRKYGLVANPEFLREGSAVEDFINPPFTVIGEFDKRSGDVIAEVYRCIQAPIVRSGIGEAMMVKYASNAFHGMKVAFANEIAVMCRREGINSNEVMDIFCRDNKLNISSRYLRPGFAFGGSCLPKDLRALTSHARREDNPAVLLDAVLQSNRVYLQRCIDLVLSTGRRNIGICGISFKHGTDDLRESPMVTLTEALIGKGLQVTVYDSYVSLARLLGSNREYLNRHIPHIASLLQPSLEKVVERSDVLVVANKEAEFDRLRSLMTYDQILIDFNALMSETFN